MAESAKVRELRAEITRWQERYFVLQRKQYALSNALRDLLSDEFEPKHYDD